MGGFLKSVAELGLTSAATAAGGPLAGAGAAAGLGMLKGALGPQGSFGNMLKGGVEGAGNAYLSGGLGQSGSMGQSPQTGTQFSMPDFTPKAQMPSLLDVMKFNYK